MSLSRGQHLAILPACLNAFYNEGNHPTEVRIALQRFRDSDFRMIHSIPTLAPGWELRSGGTFGSPWWAENIPRYGGGEDTWLPNSVKDATSFFQVSDIHAPSLTHPSIVAGKMASGPVALPRLAQPINRAGRRRYIESHPDVRVRARGQ